MEILVRAGIPAMSVLKPARPGATFFGIDKTHGTLTAGKAADFIHPERDPLANVANSRNIHSVWVNGKPIDLTTLHHRR